jgi:putative ABC transport system substrate-binding protein
LAQQAKKLPRVGILPAAANDRTAIFEAFHNGLGDFGYIDGKTVTLDYRFAKGKYDDLPEFAGELVNVPVDVIVTDDSASTLTASRATRTVPIVTAVGVDPGALGLAASLGCPGGNVTGFSHRRSS